MDNTIVDATTPIVAKMKVDSSVTTAAPGAVTTTVTVTSTTDATAPVAVDTVYVLTEQLPLLQLETVLWDHVMGPIWGGRHDGFYRVGPFAPEQTQAVCDRVRNAFGALKPGKRGFLSWETRSGAGWLLSSLEPSNKQAKPATGDDADLVLEKDKDKPSDANLWMAALQAEFGGKDRQLIL